MGLRPPGKSRRRSAALNVCNQGNVSGGPNAA